MLLRAIRTIHHGPGPTGIAKPGETFTLEDTKEADRLVLAGDAEPARDDHPLRPDGPTAKVIEQLLAVYIEAIGDPGRSPPPASDIADVVEQIGGALLAGTITPAQHAGCVAALYAKVLDRLVAAVAEVDVLKTAAPRKSRAANAAADAAPPGGAPPGEGGERLPLGDGMSAAAGADTLAGGEGRGA